MTSLHAKPSSGRKLIGLVIGATAVTGAIAFYGISQFGATQPSPDSEIVVVPVSQVTALGRLEPEAEVIQLAAPLTLDGDRLAELLVQEGDTVEADQVLAILDSRDRLQAAVREAEERVNNAQARLAQVSAGAQTGEIEAQQAAIARLQAELNRQQATQSATLTRLEATVRTAQSDYTRFQRLYQEGAIAAFDLDSRRLAAETAQAELNEALASGSGTIETLQAQLQEARARLNQIVEVRPVDVEIAQTEVNGAIAALNRAQTDLEQAYIRAPMAGQILKIHTRPGEKMSELGIAELGQTQQMMVVAEVYQTDIARVQPGQPAVVTGQAFSGELQGTVSQVGLQVSRQNTFSNQPGENLDQRVIEVKIRLTPAASQQVASLTNLQVQVAIGQ